MNVFHQFELHPLIYLNLGHINLSFTNSALWMLFVTLTIALLSVYAPRSKHILGYLCDAFYEFINQTAEQYLSSSAPRYAPAIATLFLFILFGNLFGLLPYSFTFTSQIWVTLTLAVLAFLTTIIAGIIKHRWHFLTLFWPNDVPIAIKPFLALVEVVSFLLRPISLAIRLFANMVAGHVMLKIFAGFIGMLKNILPLAVLPFALNTVLIGFEFLVAVLQAYVFTLLFCIYLRDTLFLHGEEHQPAG